MSHFTTLYFVIAYQCIYLMQYILGEFFYVKKNKKNTQSNKLLLNEWIINLIKNMLI